MPEVNVWKDTIYGYFHGVSSRERKAGRHAGNYESVPLRRTSGAVGKSGSSLEVACMASMLAHRRIPVAIDSEERWRGARMRLCDYKCHRKDTGVHSKYTPTHI